MVEMCVKNDKFLASVAIFEAYVNANSIVRAAPILAFYFGSFAEPKVAETDFNSIKVTFSNQRVFFYILHQFCVLHSTAL